MFCRCLTNQKFNFLVVMETNVSTPVLWIFCKFIAQQANFVLVYSILIYRPLVYMFAIHFYKTVHIQGEKH